MILTGRGSAPVPPSCGAILRRRRYALALAMPQAIRRGFPSTTFRPYKITRHNFCGGVLVLLRRIKNAKLKIKNAYCS